MVEVVWEGPVEGWWWAVVPWLLAWKPYASWDPTAVLRLDATGEGNHTVVVRIPLRR